MLKTTTTNAPLELVGEAVILRFLCSVKSTSSKSEQTLQAGKRNTSLRQGESGDRICNCPDCRIQPHS